MADASSHLMVFGDSPGAASPGKIRLYFNSSGVLMQVDDTGTESSVTGGITVHNLLTGRGDLDCHTMAAITGLITALAGKEASFGDPTVDGMVLASLTNGTRYWKAIEIPHIFSAKNEIWQSFQSQSEVVTEWDVEILKHSKFTHSTTTNPEEIEINHDGFIQLWVKSNFETHESNKILLQTCASLDWGWYPETIAYAYIRHQNYVNVGSATIPGVILPVTSGQILRIHNQIALNDAVSGLGDQENVNTLWGESTITIATVVEP